MRTLSQAALLAASGCAWPCSCPAVESRESVAIGAGTGALTAEACPSTRPTDATRKQQDRPAWNAGNDAKRIKSD